MDSPVVTLAQHEKIGLFVKATNEGPFVREGGMPPIAAFSVVDDRGSRVGVIYFDEQGDVVHRHYVSREGTIIPAEAI